MTMRPGGALTRRPLHFIWILDTSGSMKWDGKIQGLNVAIRETLPALQAAARSNPGVEVLMRVVTFSTQAHWHLAEPTPVDQVQWTDLTAEGHTGLGEALKLVADAMKVPPMPEKAVSPSLVLVTDGHHTDDFEAGLAALMNEKWGREAVRLAIAMGRDVSLPALEKFIGNPNIGPLYANNQMALIQQIRWATRSGVESASQIVDADQQRRQYEAHISSVRTQAGGDEW